MRLGSSTIQPQTIQAWWMIHNGHGWEQARLGGPETGQSGVLDGLPSAANILHRFAAVAFRITCRLAAALV